MRAVGVLITLDGVPLMRNRRRHEGEGFVYRLSDADDRLLYVGSTNDLSRRLRQHRDRKPWWRSVVRCEATTFGTLAAAMGVERRALYTEWPRWNVEGVPTFGPRQPPKYLRWDNGRWVETYECDRHLYEDVA